MSIYRRLFRIVSATLFSFLSIILLALTVLSPADIIYQSRRNNGLGNIFAVSIVYLLTLSFSFVIYAGRLFTNRGVFAAIPKPWIPVEKADVPTTVRRLVVEGFLRSSVIAQQARPRDITQDDTSHLDQSLLIPSNQEPPWGTISHAGWTAPHCPDLPNQEFEAVIKELPHLIEAKAVSLAPMDPRSASRLGHQAFDNSQEDERRREVPDKRVVEVLQRPPNACLRDYLNHLNHLNLIDPPHLIGDFLRLYECSRFSARPLEEGEFREMMGLFAEILRSMKEIDPAILSELQSTESSEGRGSVIGPSSFYGPRPVFSSSDPSFVSFAENTGLRPSRSWYSSIYSASDKSSFRLETNDTRSVRARRTPSTRSLQLMRSNASINSGESVIHRTVSHV
ncbi:sucrase/ferredoxin domain-containing protein [Nannizzia gypsea CBS 118893]|uniref:Defect at low temperature protein 1 n=1 Tax=Arthroderma gypseum (strain ATCC MYA-4604 / CBS 118893) TaxID=535722 RepID=E4V174_ARTGP|nr:sucrase/ferredoxin domain-containing protein [Nannizzia gypsea CBS 118893]EFR03789.1 sucrase/ferredoxin domain-containing protein [Nannizzia gypsea CBS 118893]